jgi:acyl carrier protein
MADVYQALATTIHDICGIEPARITPEKTISGDLGIDSVDFLDVIYEMDKRYGIKIPLEEWVDQINRNKAKTEDYFMVQNLVGNIEALVKVRNAG